MRTISNSADVAVCFDENVWKAELLRIYFKHGGPTATAVKMWSQTVGSESSPIATYILDGESRAVIDVTDFVRTYPTAAKIFLKCDHGGATALEIPFSVKGLINPKRLFVPSLPYRNNYDTERLIVPPLSMYKTTGSVPYIVEYRGAIDEQNDGLYKSSSLTAESQAIAYGSNTIPAAWSRIAVLFDQDFVATISPREIPCGVVPACVEWVGATGAVKRAIWLVKKATTAADESFSLVPTYGDYKTIKGRADGLTIYLDDLSRYDYFYYSDIVTSSDVRVLVGGEIDVANIESGRIPEAYTVEVSTKNATLPDGEAGDRNKIEISLNWRYYDPVAM